MSGSPGRPLLALSLIAFAVAATGFREPLTWPDPTLGAGTRTINVPVQGGDFSGNPASTDCLVRMPGQPVTGSVKVAGCRNVSLVGGEFRNEGDPCGAPAAYDRESVALYLAEFSGTAHVEGLKIRGRGFSDGIWMSSTRPGSVGQIEASWFGGFAACSEPPAADSVAGWPKEHPDCFQTWAGPSVLRFDKVTCFTVYEGLNLDTNNWADAGGLRYPARLIDIRRTNVHLDERSPSGRQCFTAWNLFSPSPTRLDRAYCTRGNAPFQPVAPSVASNPSWWSGVTFGRPPRGDETTSTEAGLGYRRYTAPRGSGSVPGPGSRAPGTPGDRGGNRTPAGSTYRLRRALKHGLFSHVRCVRPCRAVARARLGRRDARRLGLGRRSTVVARGALRSRRAGRHRFTIRFTSRARAHLRRARRVELRVSVSIRERGAKRRTLARTITLARQGR